MINRIEGFQESVNSGCKILGISENHIYRRAFIFLFDYLCERDLQKQNYKILNGADIKRIQVALKNISQDFAKQVKESYVDPEELESHIINALNATCMMKLNRPDPNTKADIMLFKKATRNICKTLNTLFPSTVCALLPDSANLIKLFCVKSKRNLET